jgi:DNA replication licensing factor MCM4
MQINHNLSQFIDKQYIKLQQLPEQLEEGSTPIIIPAIAYQDNVDRFKSGDCVQIIGIYRATPVFIQGSRS